MPKVSDEHLANRKQQILDAAANCFARNGFHRTSMQDIVRESGLSAGLIYRYFTGKDDLFLPGPQYDKNYDAEKNVDIYGAKKVVEPPRPPIELGACAL